MKIAVCIRLLLLAACFLVVTGNGKAAGRADTQLRVFFIDVEGGQSTLFVTPAGESLLIDTGWPGNAGRDADRIVSAARSAGLKKIDYVLITHYHDDHVGGVPELVKRIPVGAFIDHGPNREPSQDVDGNFLAYQSALASSRTRRIVAHVDDVLPVKGINVRVVSADGNVLEKPLQGAGQTNPYCKTTGEQRADATENARSLGVFITMGKLKILDLGDLTADKELKLMCPVNRLGGVDVLIVSHHGWNQSSTPALVDAVGARVAIMDNGAHKGGSPSVVDTVRNAPGLEALWQLHYSEEGGAGHNAPAEYIANPQGEDRAYSLVLAGSPDGAFSVTNSRTGLTRSYPPK